MENHYGRKYKDSNYLLRATGDCIVVAGPNREQNLVNTLPRLQITNYLLMSR